MTFDEAKADETKAMKALAAAYRLKLKRDDYGDPVIQGKSGMISGLWQGRLIVLIQRSTSRSWNNARRALALAGCVVHQDGDTEGSLLFDGSNPAQVKLALKLAGIRTKRIATPAQLATLAAGRRPFRRLGSVENGAALTLESTNGARTHQEPALAVVA